MNKTKKIGAHLISSCGSPLMINILTQRDIFRFAYSVQICFILGQKYYFKVMFFHFMQENNIQKITVHFSFLVCSCAVNISYINSSATGHFSNAIQH